MLIDFAELDYRNTPMGELSLRRRRDARLARTVYEIVLNDEFLMSSAFTESEKALGHLGLAALDGGDALNVLVGGLGLGYTAASVLEHEAVSSLQVIEALAPVIEWHRKAMLPVGTTLADDPRCELIHDDFFARATGGPPAWPQAAYDAVLVDIDHTPESLLDPSHRSFYQPASLQAMAKGLRAGGVFGLWADGAPDARVCALLERVFARVRAEAVSFDNPYTGGLAQCTVYIATQA